MHNMTPQIKLIALDLDGTLLNSNKELTPRPYRALEKAAEMGIEVVPTTGRLVGALPEVIRKLPFLRYVISVNGAQVVDLHTQQTLYNAEIPMERALQVMRRMDDLPVIYDCYMDGRGWMTAHMYDRAEEFACNQHVLDLIRKMRAPVPELKAFVTEQGRSVQKMQMFFHTRQERLDAMPGLTQELDDLILTSSYENNIEINSADATKGKALRYLCQHLGFGSENAISFGDGTNDLSMLEEAGIGVAMENAEDVVKDCADYITASCDEDGVALAIEKFIFGGNTK